ncbi:outer membrane protein assembly factor BamB family protein [Alienimonas californiensis]|uniref:Outer membrane biogenesis protein BamB n=1 Tax=Alienimonas californiensis TaxID=2527989 RepID=A0A517PFA2_9PLAN|nr:PQQ-binding-like beta-propeller repeat protein [Alienimonas californiensis]QDT18034.1 outer membrane biogenesis protein BamB [Alienimonas californiensis]
MNRALPFLFALTAAATAPAGDWPEFRGPDAQGHAPADETGLPVEWTETKNVVWAVETPPGWSSPVVVGDRIYLTGASEPEDGQTTLSALCLSTEDGAIVWETPLFKKSTAESKHKKNSWASPTPIFARLADGSAEDGALFVHFGPNATARLKADDGTVVWKRTDIDYPPVHGGGPSPALVPNATGGPAGGPILFIPCDGGEDPFVIALDALSGETRWRKDRPDVGATKTFSFATPLVIDPDGDGPAEQQILSPATNQIVAYDPADGEELWAVPYEGFSVTPRPVTGHGKVFLSTSFMRPTVLAIDLAEAAAAGPPGADGPVDAAEDAVAWDVSRGGPNTPSPLLIGDLLYFVSDNGVASCVESETGAVVWTERLGGNFSASPIYADGRIYWLNEEGGCTVSAVGEEYRELAVNELPGRTLASPAVSGGAIYLRTDAKLYKLATR